MSRLGSSFAAVRPVVADGNLRRLQAASFLGVVSGWAYAVALYVYAFRHGGTTAVGLVGLLVMVPAGLLAPLTALLADLYDRASVIVAALLLRAALLATAAAAIELRAPSGVVYLIAAAASVLVRIVYPTQAAMLPDVAPSGAVLAAANVVAATFESLGAVAGPAVGGVLVALLDPPLTFYVCAAMLVVAAGAVVGLRGRSKATRDEGPRPPLRHELTAGIRTIASDGDLRALVVGFGLQTVVAGAFTVLTVTVALQLTHAGTGGVGLLNAAVGVGGVLGGLVAIGVARERYGRQALAGLLLFGAPLMGMAAWPREAGAIVFAAIVGLASTLVDTAVFTLLQRAAPPAARARVFGAVEGIAVAGVGLGSVTAPALVSVLGIRGALVATGIPLPLLAVVWSRRFLRIDERHAPAEEEHVLLRSVPFLSLLSPSMLDALAQATSTRTVPAGEMIVRQGDPGTVFYVIESGSVVIEVDGRPVSKLGPSDFFGEIALLTTGRRTASAVAETETTLCEVDGAAFVNAVKGRQVAFTSAAAVAATRLARAA